MFLPLQTSSPSTVLGQITDIIKTEIGPPMTTPTVLSDKEKKRTKVKKLFNHFKSQIPDKKKCHCFISQACHPFQINAEREQNQT